ncbi:MAG: cyclic pyranopterin monophosphate synthase MoaC [Pseudomonadota bacterium]
MSDSAQSLTHVDAAGRPTMVDVGDKQVTRRSATALARVALPSEVLAALQAGAGRTKKGPVFDTAIIAGVMAAKRTHELIPFCHPLALENCKLHVDLDEAAGEVRIECHVAVSGRTGVEMEALTGASVAALTVYDMCKALSHDIVLHEVKLMAKAGGKRDFARAEGQGQ